MEGLSPSNKPPQNKRSRPFDFNSDHDATRADPKRRSVITDIRTHDGSINIKIRDGEQISVGPLSLEVTHQYEQKSIINRGSFGIVTHVVHVSDRSKEYACKQLPLAKVAPGIIRKEVELIRKSQHQHVVRIIDEYMDPKKKWYHIIMEPAAEGDLEEYLRDNSHQPRDSADWQKFGALRLRLVEWMFCLATAIDHIHQLGIRHRDIKPENILFHGTNILLTDFGTSFHSERDTRYTSTSTPGTKRYLPPEAEGGIRFGRSGDIFSLGCVFWEMAEAILTPVLGQQRFPRIDSSYSASIASGNGLLRGLLGTRESLTLKKRIPEQSRFSDDFMVELLSPICQMLFSEPASRPRAVQVRATLSKLLRVSCKTNLPNCCRRTPMQLDLGDLDLTNSDEAAAIASLILRFIEEQGLEEPISQWQYTKFVTLETKLRSKHSDPRLLSEHIERYPISPLSMREVVNMAERLTILLDLLSLEMSWIADDADGEISVFLELKERLDSQLVRMETEQALGKDIELYLDSP